MPADSLAYRYAYRASGWRGRGALARALGATAVLAALLAASAGWMARDLTAPGRVEETAGTPCGWALLLVTLAFGLWQTLLATSNALVVTADLELDNDGVVVWLARRWPVRVEARDLPAEGELLSVTYRLGQPSRIKGPLIRPRRKFPAATFVPVRRVSRWRWAFWLVARMYAGRSAKLGFVVTPDHARHTILLGQLQGDRG